MFVRWTNLLGETDDQTRLPGHGDAVVRHFDSPEALDMRFHEVHARSVLNRVPTRSRTPFRWTINPYRGCSHACVYCFARPTHAYLGFNAGRDFEREIVVKVNAPELLRAELARSSWSHEHIALGTNTDPYQWVEGRYRLMEGIWAALRDAANPCLPSAHGARPSPTHRTRALAWRRSRSSTERASRRASSSLP